MDVFQRWVADYGGPEKLARYLNYSTDAVYRWLARKRTPKYDTILDLCKLSHLSYTDIVYSTKVAPKKRRSK